MQPGLRLIFVTIDNYKNLKIMSKLLVDLIAAEMRKVTTLPDSQYHKFSVGDFVSVKYKVVEGSNTRIQAFNGVVIAKTKSDSNYSATFTVRKISSGVGVERKFHLYSPLISGIEVMRRGVVRRSKLYYLRNLAGKSSRIKEKINSALGNQDSAVDVALS